MDWFERLTGFREDPDAVRTQLEVTPRGLMSRVNGRTFGIGMLEVLSLAELRSRAGSSTSPGKLSVSTITGDVREMHRDPRNRAALFQVASQFNLLEMVSPRVVPEQGVTRYTGDPTQGPACAIAAGAATIYRNYFVSVHGHVGQSAEHQIDCLSDLGVALGNEEGRLWKMTNGYALCTRQGLREISTRLAGLDEAARDELRAKLRIGIHWNVEVTDPAQTGAQFVSQAFCSALPVAYGQGPTEDWEAFATLVLEAAYEATLLAGLVNRAARDSPLVFLTRLGGGIFGNGPAWIQRAMRRAFELHRDSPLEVRLVCRDGPDSLHRELVDGFSG